MVGLNSKLKTGDEVIVITGKDKGQKGKIAKVITKTNKVVIDGVNMVKKHISQREAFRLQREPGIDTKAMPVNVSNVMLVDPKDGTPTRVGYKIEADGTKVRIAKKSGTVLDTAHKAEKAKPAAKKPAAKKAPAKKAAAKKSDK